MANVTRTQYVNLISSLRGYPAGRTPQSNSTDHARASAYNGNYDFTNPSGLPPIVPSDIPPGSGTTPVIGDDIRDLTQARAYEWSQVRRVKYLLTGNVSPAGSSYIKYSYIRSPNQSSSVPGVGNPMFDTLAAGEEIDLADFNVILATLNTLIKSDVDDLFGATVTYCHSSCHSSCHNSRGRR